MRVAVIAIFLLASACGDDTTVTDEPVSVEIRLAGGFAGTDDTYSVSADGAVSGTDGREGRASAEALESLVDAAAKADFFGLDDEYLPEDTCCDRFIYTLTIQQGDRSHTVATIDDGPGPQSLFDLIGVVLGVISEATDD